MRLLFFRFFFLRALILLGLVSVALYFLYRFSRQDHVEVEVEIR